MPDSLGQPEIAQKLLEGVIFYPLIIELGDIPIFVGCLGEITKNAIRNIINLLSIYQ